jgi:hypothetical protein
MDEQTKKRCLIYLAVKDKTCILGSRNDIAANDFGTALKI